MSAQDLEQQARELLAAEYERDGNMGSAEHIRTQPLLPNKARAVRAIAAALRQQPASAIIDNAGKVEVHPDDAAVDRFAVAMKAKLADARAKGRGGWQGDEPGMQQRLSDMLRTHVEKGDPRDVANFAMFLHQRYESILPAHQPAPVLDDELPGMWSQSDFMGGATDAADNAHRPAPVVDDAMVREALHYCPSDLPSPKKWKWMADRINSAIARAQGFKS